MLDTASTKGLSCLRSVAVAEYVCGFLSSGLDKLVSPFKAA